MLDFGMAEFLIILVVLIFVIGPQDLPALMQGLGRFVRRIMYMKHAITMQMDEMMGTVDPHTVNTVMQKNMAVPEIDPYEEAEFIEDDDHDPRRGEDENREAPVKRDQQDLFEGPR